MAARVTVKWNAAAARSAVQAGEVRGLQTAAEHLLTESRKRVPIEEGTLERSGVAQVDPANRRAVVSYDTVYAVVQHERTDFRHDAGRSAKYLEGPFMSQRGVLQAIIAQSIRRGLS